MTPVNPSDIKIAYFSRVLNNHQASLMDRLYDLTGGRAIFVELNAPETVGRKGNSSEFSNRPYLFRAWTSEVDAALAENIAREAEVALFGGYPALRYQKIRLRKSDRLSFEVSERWLKRGAINLLSPRLLVTVLNYHLHGWCRKPLYKLCCSAYCASDQRLLRTFRGKCHKWGYFPSTESHGSRSLPSRPVKIMWCSRFIELKHPEMAIEMAHRLKQAGRNFTLDMYGSGELETQMKERAGHLGLNDIVTFHGYTPNTRVREAMAEADIFIFTSDRREGWGAVVSESMAEGCAVVACEACGSVPYLIADGVTGLTFRPHDMAMLTRQVARLIDNPLLITAVGSAARRLVSEIWSPQRAAESLLRLIDDLEQGRDISIGVGPGSPDEFGG